MLPSISAIMTEPDFGEVMFLVALIVFLVVTAINVVARDVASALVSGGFAILSLGWLAL